MISQCISCEINFEHEFPNTRRCSGCQYAKDVSGIIRKGTCFDCNEKKVVSYTMTYRDEPVGLCNDCKLKVVVAQ